MPPWREGTHRRGAPRRIATQGQACPSPSCRYHGITDAAVHALIGYGHHGTTDHIQDYRCQACGTKGQPCCAADSSFTTGTSCNSGLTCSSTSATTGGTCN